MRWSVLGLVRWGAIGVALVFNVILGTDADGVIQADWFPWRAMSVATAWAAWSAWRRRRDRRDKARLIRALAEASERRAPALESHLCQASSASLPGGR